jgi:hypothetical protein
VVEPAEQISRLTAVDEIETAVVEAVGLGVGRRVGREDDAEEPEVGEVGLSGNISSFLGLLIQEPFKLIKV